MGQSFGGFCCVTYLSFYPSGLKEVFLAGGLAPLVYSPDPVYRRLFREFRIIYYCRGEFVVLMGFLLFCHTARIVKRNIAYYKKYPKDIKRV